MQPKEPSFIVSREDWSLHRKGEIDQERHRKKVMEAIRNRLPDLIAEESIITSQGDRIVKVPIRSLDEPRFRFRLDDRPMVGQGKGGTRVGDVVGGAPQEASGAGSGAGEEPGVDYYEADVTVDELAELVFEDLRLPRLKPKRSQDAVATDVRFNDVRKTGLMSNVDKRRTLLEALKRQVLSGKPPAAGAGSAGGVGPIRNEDLRFKTWDEIEKPYSSAVVLAMMDTSGSMGTFEKYVARSFFFWMVRFLRTKYDRVDIRFLAHDVEAREVDEQSFFTKGESGGTKCSSVYELAIRIVDGDYPGEDRNVYAFHFSDGDNLDSDNALTVRRVRELIDRANLVGYGEIRRHGGAGGRLWAELSALRHEAFVCVELRDKSDVYKALKTFFGDAMAS